MNLPNPVKWFDMRLIVSMALGVALGTIVATPLVSMGADALRKLAGAGGVA